MKRFNKITWILLAILIMLIWIETNRPREIDWDPSFSSSHHHPYGSEVLFSSLPSLFPGAAVTTSEVAPLENKAMKIAPGQPNLIFLNTRLDFDRYETGFLLDYAKAGNHVFLVAEQFGESLLDTLGLATRSHFSVQSVEARFTNPALSPERRYLYRDNPSQSHFTRIDSTNMTVLSIEYDGHANFVELEIGNGRIYLNTFPYAFTNLNVLDKTNSRYAQTALSYMPVRDVIWDEYYKVRRRQHFSAIRYVMRQDSLKRAFYLSVFGLLLFVFFAGRRRQQVIPVIKPHVNTSLQFVRTVGKLYFANQDHLNLGLKQIRHFREYLREHLHIRTDQNDQQIAAHLVDQVALTSAEVQALFRLIRQIDNAESITESTLNELNRQLIAFYGSQQR